FQVLWSSSRFRSHVAAIVVDEAHCIHQWGDQFKETYQQLNSLCVYTGREIPFLECSATVSTKTFDTIWSSLANGSQPFRGIDVGCRRSNLQYILKKM
ncbi:hypothetical protein M422DRAFT_80023, partial [Sphaerobolus stellatus SS14]